MKVKLLLIILLLITLNGCSKPNKEFYMSGNLKNDIENLFPSGKVNVNILKITVPTENRKRYDQIVDKMITSYEANKADFKDSVIWKLEERIYKLKDGIIYAGMIPYDKRLGISNEEYSELNGLLDFCKTSTGIILIDKSQKDKIIIRSEQNVKSLEKIEINISKKTISTKYGLYKYIDFRRASNTAPKIITDRWSSYNWIIDTQKSSLENSSHYNSFYIGQINKTKELIIFLRNDYNDSSEHEDVILSFKYKES